MADRFKMLHDHTFAQFSEPLYNRSRHELQQPNNEWASVGALALSYFTDKYDKVAICGFDHLEKDDEGKVSHYFAKPPKDDRFHNGCKEKLFTDSLLDSGKVYRI